ncbi:MAG: acyloxyacyl hydrolase [Betaproteobacteria bacterium]
MAAIAMSVAAFAGSPAHAADIAVSGGLTPEVAVVGIAGQWVAPRPFREAEGWALRYGVEFDVLNMHARQARKYGASNIAAIGVTPMLRAEWPRSDHATFVDAGIGGHLLSHTSLQGGPNFGTAFQFGEWIGTGLRFGAGMAWEVGLRLEHLSNADIKLPNDGITFVSLRAAWHF